MRLPIRNYRAEPITLCVEPLCDEYEIPAGGTAIVILQDGRPHSIDIHPDRWITLWDEGSDPEAEVSIYDTHQFDSGLSNT